MIESPKKVFYVGAMKLVEGLGHEFMETIGKSRECEFFVGIDNGVDRRVLVNFALGFFIGLKRKCLVVSCKDDAKEVWGRIWDAKSLLTVVKAKTFNDARNAVAMFLPKCHETYEDYLRSPEWIERRLVVIKKWGGRCAICKDHDEVNVHHNTYARIGHEEDTDLVVLCRSCHRKFHGK